MSPTGSRQAVSQALRLAVALPLWGVGLGLTAVSLTVPILLSGAHLGQLLVVGGGVALLFSALVLDAVVGVDPFLLPGVDIWTVVVPAVGVGLAIAAWRWSRRVRTALWAGVRAEPAALVGLTRAPWADPEERARGTLERLCLTAGQPTPALRIADTDDPLCYTVRYATEASPKAVLDAAPRRVAGENPTVWADEPIEPEYVVVVSTGLLSLLSAAELDAVLAHEVAHLRNGDLALMNWLLVPVFWASELARVSLWGALAGVLIRTVTLTAVVVFARGREFAADAAAARMTGDPAALASAIRRLEGVHGRPNTDLRVVSVLNVVPGVSEGKSWVDGRSHPPAAKRIERLQSMAAEYTE